MSASRPRLRAVVLLVASAACAPAAGTPVAPTVTPKGAAAPVSGLTPDASFRSSLPPPEPHRPSALPRFTTTTLSNGMRLMVLERRSPNLVGAELVVRGGVSGWPQESPAAISLAAEVALHGAGPRDEKGVFDAMNRLYAEIKTVATDEAIWFHLRAATKSFDPALEMMRDMVVAPSMAQNVLDFERQHRLALVPREPDDLWLVGNRVLFEELYGAAHPFARWRQHLADALAAVTRDDLLRVWRRAVDPADATLVVAGDVDAAALAGRVEQLFAGWKHDPSHVSPQPPPAPKPEGPRLTVIDRPGAPQATVLYGATLSPPTASTFLADAVAIQLLGGMASSKLTQTLRYELGATAAGATSFWMHAGASYAAWQGSVDRDKAADVLATIAQRAADLRAGHLDLEELADAEERIARGPERDFESVDGLISEFSILPLYGLPADEFSTRATRVLSLHADDVRAEVPAPETMKAVVIGDMSVLRPKLAALGWGPIGERDPTGAHLAGR